jgi:hypothetical protein
MRSEEERVRSARPAGDGKQEEKVSQIVAGKKYTDV